MGCINVIHAYERSNYKPSVEIWEWAEIEFQCCAVPYASFLMFLLMIICVQELANVYSKNDALIYFGYGNYNCWTLDSIYEMSRLIHPMIGHP